MNLKDMNTGDTCVVEKLDLPADLEHRLEALGMTKGTKVSILGRKGRGIMIIKLRGTRFALGCNITRNIAVRGVKHYAQ